MNGSILGFDFGLARIGVAVGQSITCTASPAGTISAKNGTPDWKDLESYIKKWKPSYLIVGVPFNMDGTKCDITELARQFANVLKEKFKLQVFEVDERLSTKAARYELEKIEKKSSSNKKVDAYAACIILEDFLKSN